MLDSMYMGMRFRLCNIVCIFLLAAYPAQAQEPLIPINFKGLYDISLGSVRIAKTGIELEQDANSYAVAADIVIAGPLKLFTSHSSHTTVDARGAHFFYPERQYESRYRTKKKKKYVKLAYHGAQALEEKLDPPENRAKRPAVSEELKKKSYDPLSFILAMRQAIQSGAKVFAIDVYDGRRLTRAHFAVGEKKTLTYNNQKIVTITANVKRELVAGFTDSELNDYDKNEPPLTVYFSDDGRYIPIKLQTSFWLGTLTAMLVKECRTGESCLLGVKE